MTSLEQISLDNVTPHTLIQALLGNTGYALPEFDATADVMYCNDEDHHGRNIVHSRHSFSVKVNGAPATVDVVFDCQSPTSSNDISNVKSIRTILNISP